jgi:hypothetical protein
LWSDIKSAWIVQPSNGSPMRATMRDVKLCTVNGKRGSFVDVKISANADQVDSEFRAGSNSDARRLNSQELQNARRRLFGIVLAHRIDSAAILSIQKHKLP